MKRILTTLSVFGLIGLMSGCPYESPNPLSDVSRSSLNPALIGEWVLIPEGESAPAPDGASIDAEPPNDDLDVEDGIDTDIDARSHPPAILSILKIYKFNEHEYLALSRNDRNNTKLVMVVQDIFRN